MSPTSLENILKKHNLTNYRLVQSMDHCLKSRSFWKDKISGKNRITAKDLKDFELFLKEMGIKDKIEVREDTYFII